MHLIHYFYLNTFKYDLINKFLYNRTKNLPKIRKTVLSFYCKNTRLSSISSSLLALELITLKKGKLTKAAKPNILLKLRKGNPVGCKVILKNKQMFDFLEKLINNILPRLKNENSFKLKHNFNNNSISFNINNTFNFKELENNYYLFNELTFLTVTIVFSSFSKKEFSFLLNTFKI